MAPVGLTALLRKTLSPAAKFGHTVVSKLMENPVLSQRSPQLELPLQSSGILCRRSFCSWSPLQSPASEFAGKGKAIRPQKRAKTDKNLEAGENGSNDKCTEGKSNGGPFEERQIAAARSKKGIKSMDYTEEKVAGKLLNDRYTSGEGSYEMHICSSQPWMKKFNRIVRGNPGFCSDYDFFLDLTYCIRGKGTISFCLFNEEAQ
ncbi:unnamed protein product [Calypogeia fissa]